VVITSGDLQNAAKIGDSRRSFMGLSVEGSGTELPEPVPSPTPNRFVRLQCAREKVTNRDSFRFREVWDDLRSLRAPPPFAAKPHGARLLDKAEIPPAAT
jgi:hypothetical protein